jgi:hypothetical protein
MTSEQKQLLAVEGQKKLDDFLKAGRPQRERHSVALSIATNHMEDPIAKHGRLVNFLDRALFAAAEPDLVMYFTWFLAAATLPSTVCAVANAEVSKLFANGIGVERDEKRAEHHSLVAALGGLPGPGVHPFPHALSGYSAMSKRSDTQVLLRSAEGELVPVDRGSLKLSPVLHRESKANPIAREIDVSRFPADTIRLVVRFLEHHEDLEPDVRGVEILQLLTPGPSGSEKHVRQRFGDSWDSDFIQFVPVAALSNLLCMASTFEIERLLHLAAAQIAAAYNSPDRALLGLDGAAAGLDAVAPLPPP